MGIKTDFYNHVITTEKMSVKATIEKDNVKKINVLKKWIVLTTIQKAQLQQIDFQQ